MTETDSAALRQWAENYKTSQDHVGIPVAVLALLDERDRLREALGGAHEYIWTRASSYHRPGERPEDCVGCAALAQSEEQGTEARPRTDCPAGINHHLRSEGARP